MKTYNELRIDSRDPIKVAFKAFRADWKFMRENGWTRVAYIARYGTTRKPKMGDGGPLIWQADIFSHNRKRHEFLKACHDGSFHAVKRSGLLHVYLFLIGDSEKSRWAALMDAAKAEKVPVSKSLKLSASI